MKKSIMIKGYNLSHVDARAEFISNEETGFYNGKNALSEDVVVFNNKNKSMIIKTRHFDNPNWYECFSYGTDGKISGDTYNELI